MKNFLIIFVFCFVSEALLTSEASLSRKEKRQQMHETLVFLEREFLQTAVTPSDNEVRPWLNIDPMDLLTKPIVEKGRHGAYVYAFQKLKESLSGECSEDTEELKTVMLEYTRMGLWLKNNNS